MYWGKQRLICCIDLVRTIFMMPGCNFLRGCIGLFAAFLLLVVSEAHAAFGGLVPLVHSGQVSYNYGYAQNAGTESESTRLLVGWQASGFIWRPWFATTSMALNVGLSSSQTTTTSSEGTVGSGNLTFGIFPRSRFPFSMSYSRTDSRSEQFQDFSQVSGSTSYRVTRLALRQAYRPRAYNQLYIARYNSTNFDGGGYGSDSVNYGLDYQLRASRQTFSASAFHSGTKVSGVSSESKSDFVSLNHVYTPSGELGVNSLISHVQVDPGGAAAISKDSQAFSSFFWRPEHRAFSVSGGVRLSETKTEGTVDSTTRSLNTNLGLGYRVSRALSLNASASVGTSDNEASQTLSTSQAVSLSYSGKRYQFDGFNYGWGWGSSVSNSTSKTESGGVSNTSDRQNSSLNIGHNLGKTWAVSRTSSLSGSFSQSASGNKNSESDVVGKSLSHGASLGWNMRGTRGSAYVALQASDSRTYGEKDAIFNQVSLNLSSDVTFNRLSNMSGNATVQASNGETENDSGDVIKTESKSAVGSLSYRHTRPFGIYNLNFTAAVNASTQLDTSTPSTSWRAESTFSYALGLLSTSLNFRVSESAGGTMSKSMNFQATRTF